MTRLIITGIASCFGIILGCSMSDNSQFKVSGCTCDTLQTKQIVLSDNYNRITQYDTSTFTKLDFYKLDSGINRSLWYRDIENVDTTKFTNLWNDYLPANYRASHLDFTKFYSGKKDIELAFQFGPNSDLWAYHIFVIKKVGCCYLITRSYFRHARFTYKAYSIIHPGQVDTLYSILQKIKFEPIGEIEEEGYCGYFVDNRNKKSFFIDFDNKTENAADSVPKLEKEIEDLYEFVDIKINWTKTYVL